MILVRVRKMFRRATFYRAPKPRSDKERAENLIKFNVNNAQLASMVEELKRLPWLKRLLNSLMESAQNHGTLSDKQKSMVTSLYIDSCVISDADIQEQIECRKLILRLYEVIMFTGRSRAFIGSLAMQEHKYTSNQLKAIRVVANRFRVRLESVPELEKSAFDGWWYDREAAIKKAISAPEIVLDEAKNMDSQAIENLVDKLIGI
jgi:hypothetical protein